MRRLGLVVACLVVVCPVLHGCGGGGGGGGDDDILTFDAFQPASVVVGQGAFDETLPNRDGSASSDSVFEPHGRVAFGGGSFYVPDTRNHRVLGFSALSDSASPDFILGQPDGLTTTPGTSSTTFRFPSDCWVDGNRLFVVDTGNNRVMIWNSLPISNVPADVVVGQPSFDTAGFGATGSTLDQPRSVATANGRMLVADFDNRRVLVWNQIPPANGISADFALGQADLNSAVSQSTSQTSIGGPLGLWTDGTRVVVTDALNDRVLVWQTFPTGDDQPADVVLGQPDFVTNGSLPGPSGISRPESAFARGEQLFVADTGFCRILVWDEFPTAPGQPADQVVGQSDFVHAAANDSDQDNSEDIASASTFRLPGGVFVLGNQLLVSDTDNHRILVHTGR